MLGFYTDVGNGVNLASRKLDSTVHGRLSTIADAMPEQRTDVAIPFARRFVAALALLPIVPAAAVVGFVGLFEVGLLGLGGSITDLRWFQFLFSVLWVPGMILIWRSVVLWTLGRKWLTALVSLIPFLQVAWAKPLWTMPGCRLASDESVMMGQHQITVGLWCWLAVWIWWGWERFVVKQTLHGNRPAISVGPIGVRLAAAIGVIPFVFATFLIVTVAWEDFVSAGTPGPGPAKAGMCVSAVIAVIVWLLIWRGAVASTLGLITNTLLSAALLIGVPLALMCIFVGPGTGTFGEVVLWCLPLIGWGAWMAWTVARWPLRAPAADVDQPRCLRCGYLLRGLRATRCPECGNEPTLDELWAGSSSA